MLATIGVESVDDLFSDIPEGLRADGLDLPGPQPEIELTARLTGLAARNRVDLASFLGAGVYRHFAPAVVDQMLLRGEWYTAYTPYQPEVSPGDAAVDLRVRVADRRADRAGRHFGVALRRCHSDRRGRDDGGPSDPPRRGCS